MQHEGFFGPKSLAMVTSEVQPEHMAPINCDFLQHAVSKKLRISINSAACVWEAHHFQSLESVMRLN
jgi:hypothetical protein